MEIFQELDRLPTKKKKKMTRRQDDAKLTDNSRVEQGRVSLQTEEEEEEEEESSQPKYVYCLGLTTTVTGLYTLYNTPVSVHTHTH